ncbi:hydroxymethylglutaryl-CoA lyase, partial [Tepidimonas sp.]|uniref:hydroxymethylglutaryl-CoA lyase n=1 Tax=Tepidimonas sp. TaxID=2002775 RepID=UPI0039A00A63
MNGMDVAHLPARVRIVEVGPRDGLQNEPQPVPTEVKVELVQRLQAAGLREIEVTSYVSPKWVPQMADNHAVMAAVQRQPGVRYAVLVPNLKGLQAALADRPDEIVVFGAASEAFSQRNINCSIAESIERFAPVVEAARAAGVAVRGAISCALGCPYEGDVPAARVAEVAQRFKAIGVQRVDVADTIGVGTPLKVQRVIAAVAQHYDLDHVSGHFHDTYGQALANTLAALQMGVWNFQSSVAGLGGCPYARGATGNVATEDLVYLLHGLDIDTGIDLRALAETGAWISARLGRPNGARAGRALLARCAAETA